MKAIETRYKGYRFRSRLEARWAVFFDTLEVRYEYEKEGLDLGDGVYYLPDFYLPEHECYVEIKGDYPNDLEIDKMQRMVNQHDIGSYIFFGECWVPSQHNHGIYVNPHPHEMSHDPERHWYGWVECPKCDCLSIAANGWTGHIPCACLPTEASVLDMDTGKITSGLLVLPPSKRILEAYAAAREARFEFGETPKTKKRRRS